MDNFRNNRNAFFQKYNISESDFSKTGLKWEELILIHDDFIKRRSELENTVLPVFQAASKISSVHSVRYRIKNSEHLIEKLIRKAIQNIGSPEITIENYCDEIGDLMGVRILHLYKSEWINIHNDILKTWDLKDDCPPKAYYRKGDHDDLVKEFSIHGCSPEIHKYGYRSIHYIVKTKPGKRTYYVEIQVRTIFEEAWSEIDHSVRYPYDLENPLLKQYLMIFNRLVGSADEMGAFVLRLSEHLRDTQNEYTQKISDLNGKIGKLEDTVRRLRDKSESQSVNRAIQELKNVTKELDINPFLDIPGSFLDSLKPDPIFVTLSTRNIRGKRVKTIDLDHNKEIFPSNKYKIKKHNDDSDL